MTKWTDHLKKVFAEGKKNNKDYTLRDAMKDGKKTYKKGSSSTMSHEEEDHTSSPSRKTRTRKGKGKHKKRRHSRKRK